MALAAIAGSLVAPHTGYTGTGPHTQTGDVHADTTYLVIFVMGEDSNDSTNRINKVEVTKGGSLVEATLLEHQHQSNARALMYGIALPDTGVSKTVKLTMDSAYATELFIATIGLNNIDPTTPTLETDYKAAFADAGQISLNNAPMTTGDSDDLFLGLAVAMQNVSGYTTNGTNEGGSNNEGSPSELAWMVVSEPGSTSLDIWVDQGTTTRPQIYIGCLMQGKADTVLLAPTSYTATLDFGDLEIDHAWTLGVDDPGDNTYRKQVWRWDPGEDPESDPGHDDGIVGGASTSVSTPMPGTGGTYTYKIALLNSSDVIVAWSDEDTVAVPESHAITGAVTVTAAVASTMAYAAVQFITGAITCAMTVDSYMVLNGEVVGVDQLAANPGAFTDAEGSSVAQDLIDAVDKPGYFSQTSWVHKYDPAAGGDRIAYRVEPPASPPASGIAELLIYYGLDDNDDFPASQDTWLVVSLWNDYLGSPAQIGTDWSIEMVRGWGYKDILGTDWFIQRIGTIRFSVADVVDWEELYVELEYRDTAP